MAIYAFDVYAYVNLSNLIARVRGSDLADRGAYDSGASYAVNDSVTYGGARYVALASVSGTAPPAAGSWALLSKTAPPTVAASATRLGVDGQQQWQADDGYFYDVGLVRSQAMTVMTIGQSGSL